MPTSIEHSMPSELVISDYSSFGADRPGNIITESASGIRRSRSYADHNLAAYSLQFSMKNYTEATYELLLALMNSAAVNALPFWIKEPISKPRSLVPGEILRSGQLTYICPLDYEGAMFSCGPIYGAFSGAYEHPSANLLTDIQANAVGGLTTGLQGSAGTTIAAARHRPLDGLYGFTLSSFSAAVGIQTSNNYHPAIVASRDYTVQASFFVTNATYTYRVYGQYLTSGQTATGSLFSTLSTGTVGEWLHLRATQTAPADAAYLQILAKRTDAVTGAEIFACLGVSPGDNERWFLPSASPRLVEFTSIPSTAENHRLLWSAPSCERWARVALDRNQQLASLELLGNVTADRMSLREVLYP